MAILLLGLIIWSAVHLYPAVAPAQRARYVETYGEGPWKGAVSIVLVISILLMVIGYRSAWAWGNVWFPPLWAWHVNNLLMLVAFVLLGAGHMKSNIRRFVRHPMLTAVIIWAIAHLLANGEVRAVVFFGGIGMWGVASIILINRRDGAFVVPPPSPMKKDVIAIVAGAVVFLVIALLHPWLFGVSPFPV
jgi:uncharacterized membrane protein